MISQKITKGTTVWHEALGFGKVIKISEQNPDFCSCMFDDQVHHIARKRLLEITEEK